MFRTLLFLFLTSVILSSCVSQRGIFAGQRKDSFHERSEVLQGRIETADQNFVDCLNALETQQTLDECQRSWRDAYIISRSSLADLEYEELVTQLQAEQAQLNLGIDLSLAALLGAGTLSYGGETNEILAIIAGILNTLRASDENYTYSQAQVDALRGIMELRRRNRAADIAEGMTEPHSGFTMFEARQQLTRYEEAGDPSRARQTLEDITRTALESLADDG